MANDYYDGAAYYNRGVRIWNRAWDRIHQAPAVIVTAPSVEPVSLADAKTHCRIEVVDDNDYIEDLLIPSARWHVEFATRRALVNTVFDFAFDRFPLEIDLPLPRWPLVSVTSITSYDADNVASTFSSANYLVDTSSEPGRVVLNDGCSWPSDLRQRNAGVIRFTAGYGTTAADVTAKAPWARHAMLYLIQWWYQRREPVVVGNIVNALPETWEALVAHGRDYTIG